MAAKDNWKNPYYYPRMKKSLLSWPNTATVLGTADYSFVPLYDANVFLFGKNNATLYSNTVENHADLLLVSPTSADQAHRSLTA
jgi:hypothetical protein